MTQNPFLLGRKVFITILYYKLVVFSYFFFRFFLFFTQTDNLYYFLHFNFYFALRFVSRETIFALQYISCAIRFSKMLILKRIQVVPSFFYPKQLFCYVFSFICKKYSLSADIAGTKRGNRYIYTLFIIVAELTVIAAS